MFHNNPLLSQLKKKLNSNIPRVEGIVKSTDKGYGFLEVDSKSSYFIPSQKMKKVMHGDRVIAKLIIENFREIASPEKLITPFLNQFIGRIQIDDKKISIIPDYYSLKEAIICKIACRLPNDIKTGDWAIAVLVQHKLRGFYAFSAKIVKYIVKSEDVLTPWLVTLSRHQLDSCDLKLNSSSVVFDTKIQRTDLTHLNFITIDDSNTSDLDDALYIKEQSSGNFNLIVAIADPTSFIPFGSALDNLALNRGFTNYLPGFTIPMLPKILSENKCSLQVNKRRPVVVCSMILDRNGCILNDNTKFFLAWIESKAKLDYDLVSDWLEHKGNWVPDSFNIVEQLLILRKLCYLRIIWRKHYALLFKERLEYNFKLSDNFKILDISIESRKIAHRMIEETMILANICAAKILTEKLGFGVYNVHSGFDSANLEQIIKLLSKFNLSFKKHEIQTLSGFRKLKNTVNKMSNKYLEQRLQKFQSFGELQYFPAPHFALGLPYYATWTSPIRKYSDMINHHLLKSIINNQYIIRPSNTTLSKINDQRRRLKIAARDLENWLYVQFLSESNAIEKIFNAEIIDIFRAGMKVKLLENGAKIFIPASFLHKVKKELLCNQEQGIVYINEKKIYSISDVIRIKLVDIKLSTRSIIGKPI